MDIWRPLGQFRVGIVDVEWAGSRSLDPSNINPSQHLAGRLFYPCTRKRNWSWDYILPGISWLPGMRYAYGLSKFIFFRRPRGWLFWLAKQAVFVLAFVLGRLQRILLSPGAPLIRAPTRLPIVIFSHGLGGHRGVYAITCAELASHGYVVLALEHSDGTASCARLAGKNGYKFYAGLGGEEGQVAKTRHRVVEMKTALHVLRALHKGTAEPGLMLSHGKDPTSFLSGALDFRCVAAVGHSYGGATTAALVSEDPLFRCGVCLDPWWAALPPESAALTQWRTKAPLLVLGSHDWNVPTLNGELLCGEERQKAILEAAKIRKGQSERNGGGAMLLVIAGSSHNTFADPLPLFSEHVGWILRALGLSARLDPVLGIHLVNAAILNFLSLHLPLTGDQRQLQTWAPSSGRCALDRIAELDKADQVASAAASSGLLSGIFPGRGLLYAISDKLLDQLLRPISSSKKSKGSVPPKPVVIRDGEGTQVNGSDAPDDVVTATEVIETALPSADPSLGLHPHAPRAPLESAHVLEHEGLQLLEGTQRFDAQRRRMLQAQAGSSYADAVREDHVDQCLALLGEHHVFKCRVSV